MKRRANVPHLAVSLSYAVSKADLLEAAWHLASLCNEAGSAEDESSTFRRLVDELVALGRLTDAQRSKLLTPAPKPEGA